MKKAKRSKETKNLKKIISNIIIVIFLVIMIYSLIKIMIWIRENNNNNAIVEEVKEFVEEKENKYKVDFEGLKLKNSDVVGWLKVENTNIEYPVVKSTDNKYYLTHSFDKSENSAGWVFADFRNFIDGTDKNIIIYGHNRRDGSMFGTQSRALEEEWLSNEENHIITFITEKEYSTYQIFSVYSVENEEYYIKTAFENNEEFDEFLTTIKSRSIHDFNLEINNEDQVLTLSTCANNNNYRVVIHAKKIKE